MCELGNPDCQWQPGLPEGEYEICREHWVQLGAQMFGKRSIGVKVDMRASERASQVRHRMRAAILTLAGIAVALSLAAILVVVLAVG